MPGFPTPLSVGITKRMGSEIPPAGFRGPFPIGVIHRLGNTEDGAFQGPLTLGLLARLGPHPPATFRVPTLALLHRLGLESGAAQWYYYLFDEYLGMFKNVAGQKVTMLAIDASGKPKTGDAANITVYVRKDNGTVTPLGDTTATEVDATNAKGLYDFDLAQAESNADLLMFTGKSTTSGVEIVPRIIHTIPNNFPDIRIDGTGTVKTHSALRGRR